MAVYQPVMHMHFIDINNRIYGLRHFALLVAQKEREHFLLLVICTLCVRIYYCQKKKIILQLIDKPVTMLHVQGQGREFSLHHACLGGGVLVCLKLHFCAREKAIKPPDCIVYVDQ